MSVLMAASIIFVQPFPLVLLGAVLCFLPGWQDIKAVQEKLENKPGFSSGSQMILPCKRIKMFLQSSICFLSIDSLVPHI